MASLTIANSNTTPRSTRPATLPSGLRIPYVFVIPPEEEQHDNPPWCYFDADEQPENNGDFPSNPDIHFLDIPHLLQKSDHSLPIPISRRTSVYQPRPKVPMSRKLEKKQRPEAIKIIENKPSHAGRRDVREDSDVIEVVKVKRAREPPADLEENAKVKRSKTLKSRATEALKSIKNVGKGSYRPHVKELWTSSESMPGIFKGMQEQIRSPQNQTEVRSPTTPTLKGSLSRAASRSLSNIFHPVKRSPEPSFTIRVGSLGEAQHTTPAAKPSSFPHFSYNNKNASLAEISRTFTTDDAFIGPISPSPTIKKKHLNTKFSVRELHRLFTFASSSPDDPSSTPTAITVPSSSVPSGSTSSTSTSAMPSDYPDVPMEEDIFADAHFLELDSPERRLASRYHQGSHIHRDDHLSPPGRLGDLSFEMKLNSLHFDSLSFDPDDFDVSMEGNILR